MSLYFLDTNIASFVIKGNRPEITAKLATLSPAAVTISAVTKAEIVYGLARFGYNAGLAEQIRRFLVRVKVLPWDQDVARVCGDLRATWARMGIVLGSLDMMIAAHAVAEDAVLVTRDKALARAPAPLVTEDWVAS